MVGLAAHRRSEARASWRVVWIGAMPASPSSTSGGAGEAAMRTVVWFRRDLRVEDNPALAAAARTAGEVVPAYVWAPEEDGPYYPGRVSRWWLSQSLKHLDASLRRLGASRLVTRRSTDTVAALLELVRSTGATHLFFNHLYGSIPISSLLFLQSTVVIAHGSLFVRFSFILLCFLFGVPWFCSGSTRSTRP